MLPFSDASNNFSLQEVIVYIAKHLCLFFKTGSEKKIQFLTGPHYKKGCPPLI